MYTQESTEEKINTKTPNQRGRQHDTHTNKQVKWQELYVSFNKNSKD